MDKEENQCTVLSEETANIFDNNVLVNLFVSTQQNNLDLCIKTAIMLVFFNFLISNIFTLNIDRDVWKDGALFSLFE